MTPRLRSGGRRGPLVESIDDIGGRPFRSFTAGHVRDLPEVVFVPGLGAPGYLVPWAETVSAWTRSSVLDVPGWRWGRAVSCTPTLDGVADGVASWVGTTRTAPVVLVGHSTGAQAVVRAALRHPGAVAGVVLAGPTFDPTIRRWGPLVAATVRTVAREDPRELPEVLPSYLHSGGVPLFRFLRDALGDVPEQAVGDLVPPVLVMTGRGDGFAPPAWAARLAAAADAPHVVLPGAHNFCFPHADLADAALHETVQRWAATARD